MYKLKHHTKRVLIAIAGGLVVVVGIIAIPYPGPGWLIVFTGLAILATEFVWAQHLLDRGRCYYDHWTQWLQRQSVTIRSLVLMFTGLVIIVTVWLVNGYGFLNDWLELNQNWLRSPFVR